MFRPASAITVAASSAAAAAAFWTAPWSGTTSSAATTGGRLTAAVFPVPAFQCAPEFVLGGIGWFLSVIGRGRWCWNFGSRFFTARGALRTRGAFCSGWSFASRPFGTGRRGTGGTARGAGGLRLRFQQTEPKVVVVFVAGALCRGGGGSLFPARILGERLGRLQFGDRSNWLWFDIEAVEIKGIIIEGSGGQATVAAEEVVRERLPVVIRAFFLEWIVHAVTLSLAIREFKIGLEGETSGGRWRWRRRVSKIRAMNPKETRQMEFGLVRDMLAAFDVLKNFDPAVIAPIVEPVREAGRLMLTGEGSSRIFPAKNAIAHALRNGDSLALTTEAATQAAEYDLSHHAVCGVSNSGRTAEVIRLFKNLKNAGHQRLYSITAHAGSTLELLANPAFTLKCGGESAVAATKSVLEQALHHRALIDAVAGRELSRQRLGEVAEQVRQALTIAVDPKLTDRIAAAGTIYWAGRNDGVVEELTLKTNEITRKPTDFLPGTYAAHGVEEVMQPGDVVLWVNPFADAEEKFADVLEKGVGLTVIAISSHPTRFPTLLIPDGGDLRGYVEMAAGWNLLVEVGLQLCINLDQPQRARKVGNEFTG